jgi:acyl-CoA synthetase (AMP-forming)/AMP-acid ligase II/acyl carrier protein
MHIELDKAPDMLAMLDDRVAKYGSKTVFSYYTDAGVVAESYTYTALHQRVKSVAAYLRQEELSEQCVLLAYQPGLEFIVGYLACLFAGSIAVPVVPPQNSRNGTNFEKIADDCSARAVLCEAAYGAKLEVMLKDRALGSVSQYIFTDRIDLSLGDEFEAVAVRPNDTAFLQYTSGSTSDPKGVMVSHANLLHNLALQKGYFELTDQSKFVNWLPHFHDMGLIGNILSCLYCGAECNVMSPSAFIKKPYSWLSLISETSATYTGGPNFAYQLCVDRVTPDQLQTLDLSSLRTAYCGSEPIRPSTLIDFMAKFGAAKLRPESVTPCYGMAEATLIISGAKLSQQPLISQFDNDLLKQGVVQPCSNINAHAKALVSCGHIDNGQTILVVDPESHEIVDDGQVGEIWVSGDSVCNGYWHNPESTQAIFQAKLAAESTAAERDLAFARSGDLGFRLGDELYVSGRRKDMIIINGKNFFPQDIELVVANSHSDLSVDGGATFSIVEDGLEHVIVTHEIERVRAKSYNFDEIRKSVSAAISETFEIEMAGFVLLSPGRVAKTSSGKIMRSASKDAYLNNQLQHLDTWFSSTFLDNGSVPEPESLDVDLTDFESVQLWLQHLIADYQSLEFDELDISTPIAEYGLTSVTIMKILGDIAEKMNQEVEPTLIWEYPTIRELSNKIISLV